jgi:hypothetical protein
MRAASTIRLSTIPWRRARTSFGFIQTSWRERYDIEAKTTLENSFNNVPGAAERRI